MKEKLEQIKAEALRQIEASDALEKLNEVRVNYLGKKGELTAVLKGMKDIAPEDRPRVGQLVNETRQEIEKVLETSVKKMERAVREAKLKTEVIDVTLPAKKSKMGTAIPIRSLWKRWREFSSAWAMRWWKAPMWRRIITILRL